MILHVECHLPSVPNMGASGIPHMAPIRPPDQAAVPVIRLQFRASVTIASNTAHDRRNSPKGIAFLIPFSENFLLGDQ